MPVSLSDIIARKLSTFKLPLFEQSLHAFVEYENVEIAEKAVTELNDERNWRSSLRIRLLIKPVLKSVQTRGRKSGNEGEGNAEDNLSTSDQLNKHMEDSADMTSHEHTRKQVDFSIPDKDGHGRGKGRVRGQLQNSRGSHVGTPPASNPVNNEQLNAAKQLPGPRMPDGTKGFTMGRGKPVVSDIL
ncbi:hypothetical protein IFM89_039555 [Coptis chinensis]|uniref:Uncharacterized protein n=1 Tax=Coptis chinensis TaxID=261450 RepID=A0A835GTF4_9MAGN|nr:hypothetical protein IFM89_039555 [Coptis chinensis]